MLEGEDIFYDRQKQAFGDEVQGRIRKTEVWFEGLDGVAAEIMKNSILTGYQIGIKEGVELKDLDVLLIDDFELKGVKDQLVANVKAMSPYSKISFRESFDKDSKLDSVQIIPLDSLDQLKEDENFPSQIILKIYYISFDSKIAIFLST